VCPARSRLIAKVVGPLAVGRANVLGVPAFVARAEAAGLAPGNKAPVMATSRADNHRVRLVSGALTQLYEDWRRERRAFGDQPTVAKGGGVTHLGFGDPYP
jgi:hypothetical protein